MRYQDADLSERLAALVALVRPLARVRPRVDPHSGRVAEHFPADDALAPLGAAYVLCLRVDSMLLPDSKKIIIIKGKIDQSIVLISGRHDRQYSAGSPHQSSEI